MDRQISGVPAGKVEEVKQSFLDDGCRCAWTEKEQDGLWTVKAKGCPDPGGKPQPDK